MFEKYFSAKPRRVHTNDTLFAAVSNGFTKQKLFQLCKKTEQVKKRVQKKAFVKILTIKVQKKFA